MANTIKLGNGTWATKEGSLLAYNDENNNFKPLPFTTARNTIATVVNRQGLIETVKSGIPRIDFNNNSKGALLLEPTSTNLIQYSEAFGNAYWTKTNSSVQGDPSTAGTEQVTNGDFSSGSDYWTLATGWTIAGGVASCDGTSGNLSQSGALTVNKINLITITVSNYISGTAEVSAGSLPRYAINANGTYTFQQATTPNTNFYIISQSFNGSIDNVSVKQVEQGFASPSGDTSAFKVNGNSVVDNSGLSTFFTITAGIQSYSIFAKKGEINILQVGFGGTFGDTYANINLTNGVVEVESGQTTTVSAFGNGWYRITSVATATAGSGYWFLNITDDPSMGRNGDYVGNGTDGLYLFGAQTEQQSYATSYIKNEGTAAGITRAADSATGSGNSTVINSTEGVLYFEGIATNPDVSANSQISISSATNSGNNRVMITPSSDTQLTLRFNAGGTQLVTQAVTVSSLSVNSKIAVRWGNGNYSLYQNGSEVYTQAIASTPTGLAKLNFSSVTESNNFNGKAKDLRVYTTALTDAELTTLTTI